MRDEAIRVGCGHEADAAETWPGNDGGTVCQVCWESECAESFWEFAAALAVLDAGTEGDT